MSNWLVAGIGIVYFYICVEQLWKGNWPVALMFFGYAAGNVGMFYQVK